MTSDAFRAFYAVPFGPGSAAALEAAARGWVEAAGGPPGEWRVTPAARIHLTLKFLGDAAVDLVPRLEEALREAAAGAAPFAVEFGGWHLLPGPRDPRVLAVGVSDPTGTLPGLAAILEERAASLGFPKEGRGFLAHATVARRKPGRGRGPRRAGVPGPASREEAERRGVGVGSEVVRRVVLMRSTLGPDGPQYAVVAEAALGG